MSLVPIPLKLNWPYSANYMYTSLPQKNSQKLYAPRECVCWTTSSAGLEKLLVTAGGDGERGEGVGYSEREERRVDGSGREMRRDIRKEG